MAGERPGRSASGKASCSRRCCPVCAFRSRRPAPSSLRGLFAEPVTDVWLEIGFGSGEHLLWQAERHPTIGFIGCEPFINGVSSLLGQIEASGIKTIRIHDGDAREVLDWLPDASLGRVFLLFPDPWPKKRHQKRRLLTAETVGQLARVLKPGGAFRFASDDGDYAGRGAPPHPRQRRLRLDRRSAPDDWRRRPSDWPETRYERKALSAGRKPAYLNFRRL